MNSELLLTAALKNAEMLQTNAGRLGTYAWIIKGWTVTALAAVSLLPSTSKRMLLMLLITLFGFAMSEIVRVVEFLTIEHIVKTERAITMAMIGKDDAIYKLGFSTNLKRVDLEQFLYVVRREGFSVSRAFFLLTLLGTFAVAIFLA